MTLLQRDPDTKPDAPEGEGAPEAPAGTATCPTCHGELEPGQDWCLQCGQAQPGRLASMPGRRAVATVAVLTTLLVGGAVAASYAALDSEDPAAAPTQIAQAPLPSAAVPAAPVPAPAPAPDPGASGATPGDTAVPGETGSTLPDAGTTPDVPAPSNDTFTPPPDTSSDTITPDTSTSDTSTSSTDTGDSTADTRTTTTEADPEPVPIELADGAATLYDPYHRNVAAENDITRLTDGNKSTSYTLAAAPDQTLIGQGVTVDLGSAQGIREVQLLTKTPGFKVEIYATDSKELPTDVLDTRWAHIHDTSDVGTEDEGEQTIVLGRGTTKYRRVLLWFTAPPTSGTTIRLTELSLLG